jgi:DNA-binding transcriptional MerR regulator
MLAASQNTPQENPEPQGPLHRIGDVSRLTDTKPFVLRYWETEFPFLQPVKTPKGHRLYRREDIDLILAIKRLLYEEGFTIAGARRHLADLQAAGHGWAADGDEAVARGPELLAEAAGSATTSRADAEADFGEERRQQASLAGRQAAALQGAQAAPALPPTLGAALHADPRGTLERVRAELRAILTLLQGG